MIIGCYLLCSLGCVLNIWYVYYLTVGYIHFYTVKKSSLDSKQSHLVNRNQLLFSENVKPPLWNTTTWICGCICVYFWIVSCTLPRRSARLFLLFFLFCLSSHINDKSPSHFNRWFQQWLSFCHADTSRLNLAPSNFNDDTSHKKKIFSSSVATMTCLRKTHSVNRFY